MLLNFNLTNTVRSAATAGTAFLFRESVAAIGTAGWRTGG
jgi:hypothetical protein